MGEQTLSSLYAKYGTLVAHHPGTGKADTGATITDHVTVRKVARGIPRHRPQYFIARARSPRARRLRRSSRARPPGRRADDSDPHLAGLAA